MDRSASSGIEVKDRLTGIAAPGNNLVQPLLDVKGCAGLLGVSPDMVDRLRLRAELPAINIGFQHPGRRPKHLWRFDPIQVREWWVGRGQEQKQARACGSGDLGGS